MSAQQAEEAVREALVKLLASEDGHIQISAARLVSPVLRETWRASRASFPDLTMGGTRAETGLGTSLIPAFP